MDSLDMLNDLDSMDTITFLDSSNLTNGLWTNSPCVTTSSVTSTSLHPPSYASFSNSYLEDMTGSGSVMVNPNNVMPLHPLQHQQVTSLSVNTSNPNSPINSQNSPHSPMQASPMFANGVQQQVYHQQPQIQQRPSKSVRVLPPVSSPMQQVKIIF